MRGTRRRNKGKVAAGQLWQERGIRLTTGIMSTGPTTSAAFQLTENVISPCLKSPLYTTLATSDASVKVFGAIGATVVATSEPQPAHENGQASRMPGVSHPMFTASTH